VKTAERKTGAAVPRRQATAAARAVVRRRALPRHDDVVQRPVERAPAGPTIDAGYGDIVELARSAAGSGAAPASAGAERAVASASSSSGAPLPQPLMRTFEDSLGADLSDVRVHTGEDSQRAAKAVTAKAYTIGGDIHFGAGHYDSSSGTGQHLLAHEVAHTVQQAGGAPQMRAKLELSSPGDELEREADRAADAMVGRKAAAVSRERGPGHPAVQRQPAKPDAGAAKTAFDSTHIYSTAPEAARKRKIDEQIMGGDFTKGNGIDMHSEAYLKQLISLASKGTTTVKTDARGLQFFIVKGGGEGFLPGYLKGRDASNVTSGGATTGNEAGTVMRFDYNDLIAAFDAKGGLVSAALLQRPLSIKNPDIWTEGTANKVYDAWDKQNASLYKNTSFDVKYWGLQIDDRLGMYASGKVRIDLHKQENTNGCIFIVDPNTPSTSDPTLSQFEPKFITDVMSKVGGRRSNIGIMHMVDVQ